MHTSRSLRRPHLISMLACCGLAAAIEQRNMKVSSPLFNQISGKLGGAVGMTSKFGMQLRGLVTPANPQTGPQFIVRNVLASLTAAWTETLTDIQRSGWTELAENSSGNGSGQNAFVRCNTERQRNGAGYIADAPPTINTPWTPPTAAGTIIDDSANTLSVAFTHGAAPYSSDSTLGGVSVYCTTEQPATRNTKLHPFVYIGTINALALTSPKVFDLAAAGLRTVAGKVMYVRYVPWFEDGSIGAPVTVRKTIVA